MNQGERRLQHQARLEQINRMQRVTGTGDFAHVDHEGTTIERARMLDEEICAHEATERGLAAFERLLQLAELPESPHARAAAELLAAVWRDEPLSLRRLRGLELGLGDDMVAVIDAFRHARLSLADQVDGGGIRLARALRVWQGHQT
ncbi:hypothetical protein [Variovorax sp. OV329]|uniref:DUF7673 family protein n=1 Tax=Variovorax sp. OV329 TaxID=1882825 RepID=UPI0008E81769|nr:hypothetical protein [Variovorax sp. OV329]SFN05410.1 hypothetical protein SAMN05444747_1143 [Variovorax sp. OV329]